jgi:hypothetical protein
MGIARQAFHRVALPKVEAAFEWSDPVPGMIFGAIHFRHPRAFLRQFVRDIEDSSGAVIAPEEDHRPWADHTS